MDSLEAFVTGFFKSVGELGIPAQSAANILKISATASSPVAAASLTNNSVQPISVQKSPQEFISPVPTPKSISADKLASALGIATPASTPAPGSAPAAGASNIMQQPSNVAAAGVNSAPVKAQLNVPSTGNLATVQPKPTTNPVSPSITSSKIPSVEPAAPVAKL
jgi:hypothetical protein